MAAQLPRPGVEVVQEFQSVSPTIVTPTLVPCNIAPFFEVIEVLNTDGTLNDEAVIGDNYNQLELSVSQSSFPSPRGNIDEVDVDEETIRTFFDFGGTLIEISREQAFLTSFLDPDVATRPFVLGATSEPGGGFDVDGRTLILNIDSHTAVPVTAGNIPVADDVTITFAAAISGGTLTLAEVITQINAVIPGLAVTGDVVGGAADVLGLRSTRYGAGASVVVRSTGSANAVADGLGFSAAEDEIAVGSGFYASDDSDSDLQSPRLQVYEGTTQKLLSAGDSTVITAPNFNDSNILAGDSVVADGVLIGDIEAVESDTLTMEVEQNLLSADAGFAPRRVWLRANDLTFPAPTASSAATQTGTQQTADATPAFIVGQATPTTPIGASETFDVNVIVDGEVQATQTVSSGAGWADIPAIIAGINGTPDIDFEAFNANDVGDEVDASIVTHIGLRTKADNTGSGASLTLVAQTGGMTLGFSSLPVGDVGENIRYQPGTPAFFVSLAPLGSTAGGESITYTPTVLGVGKGAETITFGVNGDEDAIVADFNSQASYTEAYRSDAAGVPSATGGHISFRTRNANVGTTASINLTADSAGFWDATPPTLNAGTDTDLNGTSFRWSLDQNPRVYQVTFTTDEDDNGTSLQQVLDKINELTPGVAAASSDAPPFLELTSQKVGEASEVTVGDGTSNPILGFTDDTTTVGNGRPAPDMAVDINGNVLLQGQILRDGLTGTPFNPGFAPISIAYKGLRLDLSPDADDPALLTFDDVTTLEQVAPPISTDNPGSLMTFLSLLNAPSVTVSAIGVPETSADAPDGTPVGYAKAFEFLENEEVYALATASQLSVVHQTGITHVDAMSQPENKGERIYLFNPEIPDRAVDTIVGSGTDANTTATPDEVTVEVNLAPQLIAEGLDPNLPLNPTTGAIENEIFLDLGGDDNNYLVTEVVSGTLVKVRTSFATGENPDGFYAETAFPSTVISDDWSVRIRGEQLLVAGTTNPDNQLVSETIQTAASAFGNRRAFYVFPDQVRINTTGLEQLVEGYYATACIVGMVGQQPPQQGFTNFPITGLTGIVGSNDRFKNSQLNIIAAGGVYILVQDAQGAPVIARHQLSTDTTSIEKRELSITKVVDFTAKFLRSGLRNFIGRSNITQPFLDNLSTVIQGQLDFLSESGVLIGADINNIIQDADQPDTILVDITLDVPFPANFIRITLVI